MEKDIVQILGTLMAVASFGWGIVKYLQDKIDKGDMEVRKEIATFKDHHVRKDDFHQYTEQVDRRFNSLQETITSLQTSLTARLDSVILILTQKVKG